MLEILDIMRNSIVTIAEMLNNNNSLNLGMVTNNTNKTGDMVKKFDIMSNEILIDNLKNVLLLKEFLVKKLRNLLWLTQKVNTWLHLIL